MQLGLTDDQVLLEEATQRFIETELPLSSVRSLHGEPAGFETSWWRTAAELGWFAMLIEERHGGGSISDAGISDAAVIANAVGRSLQPGPVVPTNVVASILEATGDSAHDALLGEIASGAQVATWAPLDEAGAFDGGAGLALVDGRLNGTRGIVQDAASADVLVAVATENGVPAQVLIPRTAEGLTLEPLEGLDLSRRFCTARFDQVACGIDAVLSRGAEALDSALDVAVVLNLADTVGAAEALFGLTLAYAKDRIAFGRPIGSFQSIKHVLADQVLGLQTSMAVATEAIAALSEEREDASEIISMAAAYVGDATHELAQQCLQVHGGIGYTWEHDLHLFMRRIRSNGSLYGTSTFHRERLCRLHGLGSL